jgi:hypothetical protein
MAKQVLTQVYLSINAVTIHTLNVLKKAEFKQKRDIKDYTNYGSSGWKESGAGLMEGELSLELFQDYAASGLDSIMDALWLAGNAVAFELRPSTAAVGTSNPKRTGTLLVAEWNPIEGGVGDEAMVSVTFPCWGVTRATS